MQKFNEVEPISKSQATSAFESGDVNTVCRALVSMAFHESDWRWAQDRCLELLGSDVPAVSGLAATCLGHVARVHRKLDKEIVLQALVSRRSDPDIGGQVEDALDDINMYV